MRRSGIALVALLLAVTCALPGPAGATVRAWEVSLERPGAYEALMLGGFDVAHVRAGHSARVLGDDSDLARLQALGFEPRLVDADPGLRMARRALAELGPRARARPGGRGTAGLMSAPAFGAGSLGGFYTAAEAREFVDSLIATDTHGIFSRVDTVGWTYRNRPMWMVRVTGPAPGPRPRVFYNAMIHAREPEGMQALLYFLQQLHDGYGTDPDLTYLVDQRELYFMPLHNPDGYAVNESIYAATGSFGLWRKNVRDNDNNGVLNTLDGVDLNRNFGYKWGLDNTGSSPTRSSEAYRGPSAWSEPETRVARACYDSLQFTSALSFHTYSNLVLFPYSYSNTMTPDSAAFFEWGEDFAADNHYTVGNAPRLLYVVNGDADDWLYAETAEKPRVWSHTVEAGNQDDDFWPPPSRILPLAREQLRAEMGTAYLAGRFLRIQGPPTVSTGGGLLHPGQRATLQLPVKNRGLTQSSVGLLTATLSSVGDQVWVPDSTSTYAPLAPGATAGPADSGFVIYVGAGVPPGRVLNFQVRFSDDGGYSGRDSFQVVVGTPVTVFADSAEAGFANWNRGTWDTISVQRHGSGHSFADSRAGYYAAGADNRLSQLLPVSLASASNAYLFFWARWDMEPGYDCGLVEISTDSGTTWTPLAGRHTWPGMGSAGAYSGGVQPLGGPVYDGQRHEFVEERIDLGAYAGPGRPAVRIRFRLRSDSATQRDGWYVDDIRVVAFTDQAPVAVGEASTPALLLAGPVQPNPSRDGLHLDFTLRSASPARAEILGVDGRRVALLLDRPLPAGRHLLTWDGRLRSGAPAAPGIYLLRLSTGGATAVRKLVRVR